MSRITHRDCAGQSRLVRDIKADLDTVMKQDMGPERLGKAIKLSVNLSRELRALKNMCASCEV